MTAVEFAMTPPSLCTETAAQHCEWDDPLTRLLLLLELADEPAWLRDVAAAHAGAAGGARRG
jgi:hypothetical protein